MKKTISFIFLIFVTKCMFSQGLEIMLDSSKQWNILLGYYPPNGNFYGTESYRVIGDTILDGIECKKIGYSNNSLSQYYLTSIFITEDSVGRVYRVIYNSQNQEYEKRIMYDFNLNPGDIIASYSECGYSSINDSFEVYAVDTFFFAQKMRKRISLGFPGDSQITEYWYEGVGSSMGLIYPGCLKIDFGYDLLCLYQSDTLLYNYNYFGNNSCWITVSSPETKLETKVAFKPNPANDKIIICDEEGYQNCIIYDLSGRKLLISEENVINLFSLENGLYIICVNDTNGRQIKDLLVIKRQ